MHRRLPFDLLSSPSPAVSGPPAEEAAVVVEPDEEGASSGMSAPAAGPPARPPAQGLGGALRPLAAQAGKGEKQAPGEELMGAEDAGVEEALASVQHGRAQQQVELALQAAAAHHLRMRSTARLQSQH
eukprot:scaffold5320_cov350-Prasinococcus_capsulatus_cf.AAC.4